MGGRGVFPVRGDSNDTLCPRLPGISPESKPQSLFHRQRAAAVPNPLELPCVHVLAKHVNLLIEIGLFLGDLPIQLGIPGCLDVTRASNMPYFDFLDRLSSTACTEGLTGLSLR